MARWSQGWWSPHHLHPECTLGTFSEIAYWSSLVEVSESASLVTAESVIFLDLFDYMSNSPPLVMVAIADTQGADPHPWVRGRIPDALRSYPLHKFTPRSQNYPYAFETIDCRTVYLMRQIIQRRFPISMKLSPISLMTIMMVYRSYKLWHHATRCVFIRLPSQCFMMSSNRNSHFIIAAAIQFSNSFLRHSCLKKRDHAGKMVAKVASCHCGWTLRQPRARLLASADFSCS